MKKLYAGTTIKIYRKGGGYFKIIPKIEFDALLEKGLTRKKAKEFNIGNSLWNNTYNYHYTPEEIEVMRIDKIRTTNAVNRFQQWEKSLNTLESISPGITELFKSNIKDNPKEVIDEIERLNDMFHEMKIFIRESKKYMRQACIRQGVEYPKMVANTSEYKLKKVLKELGYTPKIQPYIDKLWFDFQIGNYLIELDGEAYHTEEKDIIKENKAKSLGYEVIRVKDKELLNIETLKKRLKKCLKAAK